jgi:hypothetical protein
MLTLKHFLDKPTWAAAAGYDFNYLDCLSFTAGLYRNIPQAARNVFKNFLDTTIAELPFVLMALIFALLGLVFWPLVFWIPAILVWWNCKKVSKKYRSGIDVDPRVLTMLNNWRRDFERKEGGE